MRQYIASTYSNWSNSKNNSLVFHYRLYYIHILLCTHLASEIIQYELTTVLTVLFTEFAIEIQCKYRLLKLLFIARLSEDAAAIIFKDALEFILIEIGQYQDDLPT